MKNRGKIRLNIVPIVIMNLNFYVEQVKDDDDDDGDDDDDECRIGDDDDGNSNKI